MSGILAGAASAAPALVLLWYSGAVKACAVSVGLSPAQVLAIGAMMFVVTGALYGRVFMRAANDWRGGWMFGAGYGFLVWMLGAAGTIQWAVHKPLATGVAAQGILGTHLLYGTLMGLLFPLAHKIIDRNGTRLTARR